MLTCLLPLVGLKGLALATPPKKAPSYYVNDLPGLSSEMAANLTDTDAADLAGVWAAAQRRAATKLVGLVERQLADARDWVRFLGETDRAQVYQPRTLLAAAPGLYGVSLTVREPATVDVYLSGLMVFASSAALGVPLVAFDLGDGQPLDFELRTGEPGQLPATVDLAAGLNEIDLGELRLKPRYKVASLFIGLDLSDALTPTLLSFVPPADVPGLDFEAVRFGPGAATDTYGATYYQWEGHGVHPLIQVECSAEKLICKFAHLFGEVWVNLLGAELLRQKVHSDRTNYFTLSNLALTQDNLNYLNGQALTALKSVVQRLPASVACQVCQDDTNGVRYDEAGNMP